MEKSEAIELALAKLTQEEKELLGLIKKQVKPKEKKFYKFKIKYMIGDADGYISEEVIVSVTNPFVQIVNEALCKLKPRKGHWGISLQDSTFQFNFNEKNISKLEYDLLCCVYSYDEDDATSLLRENGFEDTETNRDYLLEFECVFRYETAYSFLTYQSHSLK